MSFDINPCLHCRFGRHGPRENIERKQKPYLRSAHSINAREKETNSEIQPESVTKMTTSRKLVRRIVKRFRSLRSSRFKRSKREIKLLPKNETNENKLLSPNIANENVPSEIEDGASIESLNCCESERRMKALVEHYKQQFNNRSPDYDGNLLEFLKRLVATLTPCTFVRSTNEWEKMRDVLQELIGKNVDLSCSKSDNEDFTYVGEFFITSHRFIEVQMTEEDEIVPDPKSNLALPTRSKWVNWLAPAAETEIFAEDHKRQMIAISSVWFIAVDSDIISNKNIKPDNRYDRFTRQLLTDLFKNGCFGIIGEKHNLIIPLIFSIDSSTSILQIPVELRPFVAVLTEEGLFLGRIVFEYVYSLLSFLLNDLVIKAALEFNITNESLYKLLMPASYESKLESLQILMFMYYLELRLFSTHTRFIFFELLNRRRDIKEKVHNEQSIQCLTTLLKFGTNLLNRNSDLLLQCILQTRFQFKQQEYWLQSSLNKSILQQNARDNSIVKTIVAMENTFGKIYKIIMHRIKCGYTISDGVLSQSVLRFCFSFFGIFFQDCDFQLNEELQLSNFLKIIISRKENK